MARTVRDAALETRAARARLKGRKKPYWRTIERGAHLGYYRGTRGGSWVARYYVGGGGYHETTLATADDILDADNVEILSFAQAQARARTWFAQEARRAAGLEPASTGPYTVENAITDYLGWFEDHKRSIGQTRAAADAHITPTLGSIEVARLTPRMIRDWHVALATSPARVRSKKGKGTKLRKSQGEGADAKRRRRASANRVLTILKAALNHAWREGKVQSDDAWRRVKPFHDVDAPVVRYLKEAECVRLVNASDKDFRPLVRAALLTGARYGELVALQARDFNPDAGTLTIRMSKSGKARHVTLTDEGRAFFADAVAGKTATDLIFTKPDGKTPWGRNHQQRPLSEACKRAKILPAASFHILRHTHGSTLAMHGVPMPVIARQLGHADTRMTERHYAHLSPSYVADTIRASFPTLGIIEKSKVAPLRVRSR